MLSPILPRSSHRGVGRPSRSSGFTLLELLVVVTIIAVLSALLFAASTKAQRSARTAACISSLKQQSSAMQLYASENDGLLPALRYRAAEQGGSQWDNENTDRNPSAAQWQIELSPYLKRVGNFKEIRNDLAGNAYAYCAEYALYRQKNKAAFDLYSTGGIGMNARIGDEYRYPADSSNYDFRWRTTRVSDASKVVLLGDSSDYHLDVRNSGWEKDKSATTRYGGYVSGDPTRHAGRANYCFVDGHIESLEPNRAIESLTGKPLNP